MGLRAIRQRVEEAAVSAEQVAQDAAVWKVEAERGIEAPYVAASVSTLGGPQRPSLMVTACLDPREQWRHGILENARYARFIVHADAAKLEQIATGVGMPKFRKRPYRGMADAIAQINAYLKQAAGG